MDTSEQPRHAQGAPLRIGWMSFHAEGLAALEAVLRAGHAVSAVITLRPDLAARRSASVDFHPLCRRFGVPLHEIGNVNDAESLELLENLHLDLLFVIGWSQILRSEALRRARLGVIGAHASLLPRDRGSAPINWALIKDRKMTGNSLIWLTEDLDGGPLIDQVAIPINDFDSCASLYDRVAASNAQMILQFLARIGSGDTSRAVQADVGEPALPRRRPEDGRLDWTADARTVYNLVRAVARPYPGAFTFLDGECWRVWSAMLCPMTDSLGTPGTVLGPVKGFAAPFGGQLVACGSGAVLLLEIESAAGVMQGQALAELPWQGKVLQ